MRKKSKKRFIWGDSKQLSILSLLLATFIPSIIAFTGFHFILPILVENGISVFLSWGVIASIMLLGFNTFAILKLKAEAKKLKVSVKERLCLRKISKKELFVVIGFIILALVLTMGITPVNVKIINYLGFKIPGYLPFFLNPSIDPGAVDSTILTGGISVSGKWSIFIVLSIALLLNVFTEEFYFRGWMLPKMANLKKWSWVLNAVLFTFYHTFQLWLFFIILVPSLVFAYITYRTKSIIPSLVAHLLLNTLNIIGIIPLFIIN